MIPAQLLNNKYNLIITMLTIALMFSMLKKVQAKMSKPIISCAISVQSTSLRADEILLDFIITNNSNKGISLLTWYSPLEGFLSNLFVITKLKNNELIEYQGPLVKRSQPTEDDFLSLAAKESITRQIDLSQAYQLTEGRFSLKLNRTTMQLRSQGMQSTNINCSPEITVFEVQ